ncbi:MAG: DUF3450 domain-containing protein [Desulfarculaceae bacterium]|nr:DUF3450 domain-containing protein [Desulfarculaceae bacterium]MCF8072651.1 DUF3450 domain-containing protein [Desulfarculaceae bacterium]MCF8102530.1 DUF3450 domain-containing protein [Desulfarculaceae bacterium]
MSIPRRLRWLGALVLCASLAALGAAPPASQVQQQSRQAVGQRQQAQKARDAWAGPRAKLADDIEAAEKELKLISAQRVKAEAYLAGQRAKVAELRRRLAEMARIRAELEPLLDASLARLDAFVAGDLPFLAAERTARLKALAHTLNDYDASLAAKARRLLEALEIEARFGSTVSVEEAEMELGGARRRVRLLRLGRLALFALEPEGKAAWRWDRAGQAWQPQAEYARELNLAAEIAQRRRVVSLVELPVGLAPPAGEAK